MYERTARRLLSVLLFAALGCSGQATDLPHVATPARTQASSPARAAAQAPSGAAKTSAPPVRYAADAFLVHASSGELVLRSASTPEAQVLAPGADLALYDPALELLWYLDGDRLDVLDLREPGGAPVVIARDMPDAARLAVKRAAKSVASEDGCDAATAVLHWDAHPSVEALSTDPTEVQIEGRAWLQAQLERPSRAVPERRDFSEERLRLPKQLLDCEDAATCATTAAFGTRPWQLVLVMDKAGGDCWNRGCLLYDPGSKLYASPLERDRWGSATQAKRGPCGLYYFNEAQSSFLVGSSLCSTQGACQKLNGVALGWLEPGDTVGAVGDLGP